MAFSLKQLASGMFSRLLLNNNFKNIENEVNNNLLHRQGTGSSVMKKALDMDSNDILNIGNIYKADGYPFATMKDIAKVETDSVARDSTLQSNIDQRDQQLQTIIDRREAESLTRDVSLGNKINIREVESINRDSALQNSLSMLGEYVSGSYVPRFVNTDFVTVIFPWDLGGLIITGSTFFIENMPLIRVDLSYGNSVTDLGTL